MRFWETNSGINSCYSFGSVIQSRSYSSGAYRFGFNGKEKDNENNCYDYGFRIYNPALGKFLSVDPLRHSFPHLSCYQFASNIPIAAIDLDGLESKIVVMARNSTTGCLETLSTEDYGIEVIPLNQCGTKGPGESETCSTDKDNMYIDHAGPLGHGTYLVILNDNGTFDEYWTPDPGNSVDAFSTTGVSKNRWMDWASTSKGQFMNRLQGKLIESMVEKLIYNEQLTLLNNPTENEKSTLLTQIKNDVSIMETDNEKLKGKFATFKDAATANKYTKNWTKSEKDLNSTESSASPHRSKYQYDGPEYKKSDILAMFYDGLWSSSDNIGMQIGLVREGLLDHISEAAFVIRRELRGEKTNLGAENGIALKKYIEKE